MKIVDLADKSIIITGAGSGIGRETAIIASKLNARLILLDISEEGLNTTMSMMNGDGHICFIINLADIDQIANVVNRVTTEVGQVNGLVHCAGISSRRPLNVLTRSGFNKVMDINFYSFVELVRQLCKKKNFVGGGSIVVMSSISSIKGYKAKTEYCVSKASVDAFVRCIALELANRRIRVNSVMAAEVLTPMALKAQEINMSVGAAEFNAPLGATMPQEVANTICFLLSDATKTITGTSVLIDGGACI